VTELGEREKEVLRSVVSHYAATGEPVSSRTASRISGLGLSSASIRNIMADLEDEGYICHTHASSGRLPTDKGYRYFVDHLMSGVTLSHQERRRIKEHYEDESVALEDILKQTSELLSTFTNQTGIVTIADFGGVIWRRVDFVRIKPSRILAIFVSKRGVVTNRVVNIDEPLTQDELDKLARYLNERFGDLPLNMVQQQLLAQMEDERRRFDKLLDLSIKISEQMFTKEKGASVFVGAKQNILGLSGSEDIERLRALYTALEQKSRLVKILGECISGGPRIYIGKEFDVDELSDYSLVANTYGMDDGVLGTIGIIGPTRMQYAKLIAIVDFTAQIVSRLLSQK